MLLIVAASALAERSEGIRIVSARDLLNYAEMPTFRDAVLDHIRHMEDGGHGSAKRTWPRNLPLMLEQILTIMGCYTKDNMTELDRNWELVMISTEECFSLRRCTRG